MIREFEASEFIAMIALNEYRTGHNSLELSFGDLFDKARQIEKTHVGIRINLSSNSIQSFMCRRPRNIHILQGSIVFNNIKENYYFLRCYATENTLQQIDRFLLS